MQLVREQPKAMLTQHPQTRYKEDQGIHPLLVISRDLMMSLLIAVMLFFKAPGPGVMLCCENLVSCSCETKVRKACACGLSVSLRHLWFDKKEPKSIKRYIS